MSRYDLTPKQAPFDSIVIGWDDLAGYYARGYYETELHDDESGEEWTLEQEVDFAGDHPPQPARAGRAHRYHRRLCRDPDRPPGSAPRRSETAGSAGEPTGAPARPGRFFQACWRCGCGRNPPRPH